MLRVTNDARFIADAKINLKGLQAEFKVECRLVPTDELIELRKRQQLPDTDPQYLDAKAFCRQWLTGWPEGEVADPTGAPLPYSAANVEQLLNMPYAPVALINAFYSGYDEATAGNSEPLSAG